MSNSSSSSSSGGIGFCGLLAIVFITLKLTGVIAWSWLWVLAPLWMPLIIVLGFLLVLFIGYIATALIAATFASKKKRRF